MKDNTDLTTEMAKILGSRGGSKTFEIYGTDHMKEISKKGLEARRANKAKRENSSN